MGIRARARTPADGVHRVAAQSPRGGFDQAVSIRVCLRGVRIRELIDVIPQRVFAVLDGIPPGVQPHAVLFEEFAVLFHLEQEVVGKHAHLLVGVVAFLADPLVERGLVVCIHAVAFGERFPARPVFAGEVRVTVRLFQREHAVFILPHAFARDVTREFEGAQQHGGIERAVLPCVEVVEVVALGFAPGGRLAGRVAQAVAVVQHMLGKGAHRVHEHVFDGLFLGVIVVQDVVGDLVDEQVPDDFVRAGVGLVDHVVQRRPAQKLREHIGQRARRIDRYADEVFPLDLAGRRGLNSRGLRACVDLVIVAVVEVRAREFVRQTVGACDKARECALPRLELALVAVLCHGGPVVHKERHEVIVSLNGAGRAGGAGLRGVEVQVRALPQRDALVACVVVILVGIVFERADIRVDRAGAQRDVREEQHGLDGLKGRLARGFELFARHAFALERSVAHQLARAVHAGPQAVVVGFGRLPVVGVFTGAVCLRHHAAAGDMLLRFPAHKGRLIRVGEVHKPDVRHRSAVLLAGHCPQAAFAVRADQAHTAARQVPVAHEVLHGIARGGFVLVHTLDAVGFV